MGLLSNPPKSIGQWGEDQAARWLRKKGYRILERNYSCRFGEIDLIVTDRKSVIFVEVKTRKNDHFGDAKEYVSPSKQRRVLSAASVWLSEHDLPLDPRFDVIEVYGTMEMPFHKLVFCQIENAFD